MTLVESQSSQNGPSSAKCVFWTHVVTPQIPSEISRLQRERLCTSYAAREMEIKAFNIRSDSFLPGPVSMSIQKFGLYHVTPFSVCINSLPRNLLLSSLSCRVVVFGHFIPSPNGSQPSDPPLQELCVLRTHNKRAGRKKCIFPLSVVVRFYDGDLHGLSSQREREIVERRSLGQLE